MAFFSAFHGIELGKKGLISQNSAINTIGHNLSNINTEGYSRQRVDLQTFHPLYDPALNRSATPGQYGTGVVVQAILRIRDEFIDDRINFENKSLGFWEMRQKYLHELQLIYNEPEGPNIRSALDTFWEAWQKVAMDPTEMSARIELIQRAKTLSSAIRHTFSQLKNLRDKAELMIHDKVNEINNMLEEIAKLNLQITKLEALGDRPNDLYDRRDLLVEKLAKMIPITVGRSDKDEFMVFLGSDILVQGGAVHKFELRENLWNEGYTDLYLDGRRVLVEEGELGGLFVARDYDIKLEITRLDSFAINLIDSVNEIHRDGFGLNGATNIDFFIRKNITPDINGNYDFNKDGIPEVTAIYKVSGTAKLTPDTVIGVNGELNLGPSVYGGPDIIVRYNETDTVQDVINKINDSGANVVAYLNHRGELVLKAKAVMDYRIPQFSLLHIEDSGNFLVGVAGILRNSGPVGAFDYQATNQITQLNLRGFDYEISPDLHPASWIDVNPVLERAPEYISAAGGLDNTGDGKPDISKGIGDNSIALEIAKLKDEKIMVENKSTFHEFLKFMIGDVGVRGENANFNIKKQQLVVENLKKLREEVSGVNIDEELSRLIMFQHAYNASARFISFIDRMLDTIINRMV